MSVIVLCVYGPSARLPFRVICNVGPELSFVLVPRSLMPDSSSARIGGAGSSVRSDILYIGSVITSESPHVARAQKWLVWRKIINKDYRTEDTAISRLSRVISGLIASPDCYLGDARCDQVIGF